MIALATAVMLFSGGGQAGPDSSHAIAARTHSDDTRLALGRLFSQTAAAPSTRSRDSLLAAAERLAAGYDSVWHDPFLQQQVTRFQRWSLDARRRKVAADSLRLAGNAALGN